VSPRRRLENALSSLQDGPRLAVLIVLGVLAAVAFQAAVLELISGLR
jgi:hypothetical protein